MAYLDTSVLGSYYCPESLSAPVSKALLSLGRALISPLVVLEFTSLVSLKVRTGELSPTDGGLILKRFQHHLNGNLYQMAEIGQREFSTARRWIARLDTNLRTLDALHLAVAVASHEKMWTTDRPLAKSAGLLRVPCMLID